MGSIWRKMGGHANALAFVGTFLLIVLLVSLSSELVRSKAIKKDAKQNVAISLNLWAEGSFSLDGHVPTFAREPMPIALNSLYLAWLTDIPKTTTLEALTTRPEFTRQINKINLFYVTGVLLALWWLSWRLTRSHIVGALSIFCVWRFALHDSYLLTRPLTEAPAALLIILAAGAAVWVVQTGRPIAAVFLGATLGALALTKAAAFYVAIVTIPLLAAASIGLEPARWRRIAALSIGAALIFAMVVLPWMIRNYIIFDDFSIAQRGGIVLLTRAIKNQMSDDEYKASFYVYAPPPLRALLFEKLLGYKQADLQAGGRWARLVRMQPGDEEARRSGDVEGAVSYYAMASALQKKLSRDFEKQGLSDSVSDKHITQVAIKSISERPARHVITTLPFAWRGIWSFSGAINSVMVVLGNFVAFGAFLALPLIALWRRRIDWLAFSIFGIGMFWFYAGLTHFIPRYSVPLIPLAILSVLLLIHEYCVRRIVRKENDI